MLADFQSHRINKSSLKSFSSIPEKLKLLLYYIKGGFPFRGMGGQRKILNLFT